MSTRTIERGGQALVLLPEHAVWWAGAATLIVADLHLGKDNVFRRKGVAIPEGPVARDLERLDALIARWPVQRLLVLGDLVHAPPAADEAWPERVAQWREVHAALDVDVVLGNHDRGRVPAEWRMTAHRGPLIEGGLSFDHEHVAGGTYCLSGHLHPAVKLRDAGTTVRLPAYWCRGDGLVLPAFGRFTGTALAPAEAHHDVFVVAGDEVFEMPRRRGGA